MGAPTLADVDGDHKIDIVVSLKDVLGVGSGGVQIWTVASAGDARPAWPTGRGNALRTGQALGPDGPTRMRAPMGKRAEGRWDSVESARKVRNGPLGRPARGPRRLTRDRSTRERRFSAYPEYWDPHSARDSYAILRSMSEEDTPPDPDAAQAPQLPQPPPTPHRHTRGASGTRARIPAASGRNTKS